MTSTCAREPNYPASRSAARGMAPLMIRFDAFKYADIVFIYKWDINVDTVPVMNKINYLCTHLSVGPGYIVKGRNYERGH